MVSTTHEAPCESNSYLSLLLVTEIFTMVIPIVVRENSVKSAELGLMSSELLDEICKN